MNPSERVAGPLSGCTIVEIGLDEAGQHAGMLLARLGARVVKLEPLEGEAGRLMPPFADDTDGRRRSVPYEFLNAGKDSIALDLDDAFAFGMLAELVGDHGAVLVSPKFASRVAADLEAPVIAAGAHGATGINVDLPSSPFTRFQSGGSGFLIPGDRPTMPGTLAGECFAGAGIAVCVLGLLLMRLQGTPAASSPLRADYSQQAHAANLEKLFVGRASKDGVEPTREGHRYPFGGAVRCSDGYVSMLIFEEHQWRGLCRVIGRDDWAADPRFKGWAGRAAMKEEIDSALQEWCASRSVAEVLRSARPEGVAIGAVRSPREVLSDEWLQRRGFIREAETAFGPARVAHLPFGPHPLWNVQVRESAPLPGDQSRQILRQLGYDDAEQALLETLRLVRYPHATA